MRIGQQNGLRMPPSVSSMLRALVTLDGTIRLLSPGYEIVAAAQRLAQREATGALTPETLTEDVRKEMIRLAPILRRAPHHLDRIAGQLSRGRLAVRVSLFSTDEDTRWLPPYGQPFSSRLPRSGTRTGFGDVVSERGWSGADVEYLAVRSARVYRALRWRHLGDACDPGSAPRVLNCERSYGNWPRVLHGSGTGVACSSCQSAYRSASGTAVRPWR